jgi:hypothetical protein
MGIHLGVDSRWDRSWDHRSHRERYPTNGRVDKLEPSNGRNERGKRTDLDLDSPGVLEVMPLDVNGALHPFAEAHVKLVADYCDGY